MSMSWFSPCPIQGTLHLTRDPFRHGLGLYVDTEGNTWDVVGLIGGKEPYIQARLVSSHPGYYSTGMGGGFSSPTASGGNGQGELLHTWKPYYYEVGDQPIPVGR